MPERYYEDVEKQCSPVTRSQYASNWYQEEEVIIANPGELATFTVSEDATITVNELAELEANSENPNNRPTEVSRVLEEIPIDKQFSFTTHVKNSGQNPIFIQVLQMGENNQWQTLASTTVHVEADIDLMSLSKHNTNPLKVVFSTTGIARFSVGDIHLHRRDLLVSTITDYLCSVDDDFGGDYRFGFNGQEKDNEIKGVGNSLDFGGRMHDSRLGRWNRPDPYQKLFAGASPYNFALNTPIQAVDPNGRLVIFVNGLRMKASVNEGIKRIFNGFSSPKLGDNPNFSNGEGVYSDYSKITGNPEHAPGGKEEGGYWSSVMTDINRDLDDYNNVFADGTNRWYSGEIRYEEGKLAAKTLAEQIQSGTVKLQPGETIKIVGHSQGARYAAGMAQQLIDMGYPVELVLYYAPHQPSKIKHPAGIPAYQWSRHSDAISSRGFIPFFVSRSHFSKIPGVLEKNFRILPDLFPRRGLTGWGGHYIDTYKGYLPSSSRGGSGGDGGGFDGGCSDDNGTLYRYPTNQD